MSQEIVMQPSQEGVMASANTTPSADQGQKTSVASKQASPKRQGTAKSVSSKTAAKPKAVTQATAKPSAKTEKPVAEVKKVPVKAIKPPVAKAKAEVAVPPKEKKVAKVKKQAPKKPKLIRDSFTIPEKDYALFAVLKQRAMKAGIEIKKGELLRASIVMLNSLGDAEFISAISSIERIKTGRPKK